MRYHSFSGQGSEPGDDRRSIERELKRGSLELIVLHLLASGEAYGYEIVSKLTAETNGALEVTDGTLYPVLYRLERAGFVDGAVGNARARRAAQVLPADRHGPRRARATDARVDHVRQGDGEIAAPEQGGLK